MIEARDFVDACLKRELSFWSGVPCSYLAPFIRYVGANRNLEYLGAGSAGEALGIAVGATLAGRRGVAMCPNTRLGDLVDPLGALVFPYRIPLLLLVSQRGIDGSDDGPECEMAGRVTGELLTRLRIEWEVFPEEPGAVEQAVEDALESMESTGLPFAFVLRSACVSGPPAKPPPRPPRRAPADSVGSFSREPGERMSRREAVQVIRGALSGEEALVAASGGAGRELCALGHRSNQFYVPAPTGCAAAVGLGVARARRRRDVVVLDGDGALLARLGSLATIGHYGPPRFMHVLLDDECYEEAAGAPSLSPGLDFAALAAACGYASVWWTDEPRDLDEMVRAAQKQKGPSFLHVKVSGGSEAAREGPGRTPVQIKHQFMDWVQER